MGERDYVLGTNDAEIERLGLQHRVWRARTLECWRRAGITEGSKVLDIGAGPGFATRDLAEIVGPAGKVVSFERSERFVAFGRSQLSGYPHVEYVSADLVTDDLNVDGFDAAWCRWVMSFVSDPPTVISKVARALRPGGVFALHEYIDYRTWSAVPHKERLSQFVDLAMKSWRDAGGEPDIARTLPGALVSGGFEIMRAEPIVFAMRPSEYVWQWPTRFLTSGAPRLRELGYIDEAFEREVMAEHRELAEDPNAFMISPMVLEIIARRKG